MLSSCFRTKQDQSVQFSVRWSVNDSRHLCFTNGESKWRVLVCGVKSFQVERTSTEVLMKRTQVRLAAVMSVLVQVSTMLTLIGPRRDKNTRPLGDRRRPRFCEAQLRCSCQLSEAWGHGHVVDIDALSTFSRCTKVWT